MTYFITGGAGSLGKRLCKYILENTEDDIIVFSRDELKHFNLKAKLQNDRVEYILGDVKDIMSVYNAMPEGATVIHAAALKHVTTGENQAIETVKTNVIGTQNVINTCKDRGCQMLLIGTDKAVYPANAYGASKMLAEKLVLQAGFKVLRYGNVVGSSGSVFGIFDKQAESGEFYITDKRCTRFFITFDDAIKAIMTALESDKQLYIPKMKSLYIMDLIFVFNELAIVYEMGLQKSEKIHEVISLDPFISSMESEKYTDKEVEKLIEIYYKDKEFWG